MISSKRRLLCPAWAILALVACGQDPSATDTPALMGPDAQPSTGDSTSSPNTNGSGTTPTGGIIAIPSGSAPVATTPATGPSAPSTSPAAPTQSTPLPSATPSPTSAEPSSPSPTGPVDTTPPAPTTPSTEVEGGGGGPSNGSGGEAGAGTEPEPSVPTPEEEPPSFQKASGTIPNAPQPTSSVDLNRNNWRDGIISPSMNAGHQINQQAVFDGYLFIGGNEEFWFYDVSNPAAPREVSYFETPNRRRGSEAETHTLSFARYGDEFYLVTIGGTGIDTWRVTDTSRPQHLAKVTISGVNYGDYTNAVWGVTWQGQYIYVGATNNGVKVIDAADPAAPQLVGEIPTSQFGGVSAGPVEAIGNVLVVMTPKESGGIATLDISDPTRPTRLASFTTQTSYIGQFYGRWAFLIGPLRAWDVLSDPRNIGGGSNPVGRLDHGGAEYMTFSDDHMFLGHVRAEIGGDPGASKIDISNPSSMRNVRRIWGRMDLGNLNDDQFVMPLGNLVVIGDDQSPYPGWFLAVHQPEPDTTPPRVHTILPKNEETGVPTKSRIGITFTDNIELATVNAASFIVRPVGGAPLAGKYGSRMTVLNFDPDEDLQPNTTYEVVLRAGGIADLTGNTLATEWKSTFTTN